LRAGRTGSIRRNTEKPSKSLSPARDVNAGGNREPTLRRIKFGRTNLNKTASGLKKNMSPGSDHNEQPKRSGLQPGHALRRCAGWVLAATDASPEIQSDLVRQSLTKPKTLVAAAAGSTLLAASAAAMSGESWAYLWLLAQVAVGGIRLLVMVAFLRAEASGRNGNTVVSVAAGLLFFSVFAAGCCQCIVSGEWPLILMAGVAIASLMGGVASRDAGTPRYGIIIISIMTLPFAFAALRSPIAHLFIIGIQLPLYACGVIFVMLENSRILSDLHHSELENRRLAQHDLLTGLPNRALNLERFDQLLKGLRSAHGKTRPEFMVFCLDLDGFKDVNDSFGHAAGDAILVAVARRLRDSVRSLDFISRTGGDEFVILLPVISAEDAEKIAERIIASIAAPFDLGLPAPVYIGISIGSACAPDDGETADELLRSADRALYEAKRRGRGVFVTHGALKAALAPSPDADPRMAASGRGLRENRRRPPLPFRSKSV
jgi:diguanylate cyclase (GGDEF)-like protein